jgi:hypothetical protein
MHTKEQRREYYLARKNYYNEHSRKWNREHPKICRESCKKSYRKLRLEVLIHYGGNPPKCACCGESHEEFLAIDHINNNGCEDRRKGLYADKLYRWLIKNNYPKEFRVLCHNCNQSLGHHGYCPHQKEI